MQNANLEQRSLEVWDLVCKDIELILTECHLYGLSGILTIPHPSIQSRLTALKQLDVVIDAIITATCGDYSISRIMLNAKQQILHLEILLNAAKNDDSEGFDLARNRLGGQSTH